MEDILNSISNVENSLSLVENLLQNILIIELPEGDLVMNLRFNQSMDYDPVLIGGLTATIEEFSSKQGASDFKSISLENLNLLFTSHENFLIVFAVDSNYPDEQFREALIAFREAFASCLSEQEYGMTMDGGAVAVQTIHTLISEDVHMEIRLGQKVSLYAFKLKEAAEKTANGVLGLKVEETETSERLPSSESVDETPVEPVVAKEPEERTPKEAMDHMLKQFVLRFDDVLEITLIRTTMTGEFEHYSETKLSQSVSEEIYETVNGMIDIVSNLLEEEIQNRTIDLGEHGTILFQNVSDLAFLYIVITNNSAVDMLEPIIERIANKIHDLFPDDILEFT